MLKKCKKKAFLFFIVFSFFIVTSHFNGILMFEVYASSSVSVKGTIVNVRSGPGTDYKVLGQVSLGHKIIPLETVKDKSSNGKNWYKFLYDEKNAYIRTDFCKEMATYVYDAAFEAELTRKGFPESYKVGLRDLHANYPNWVFTLHRTGLDFDYAVDNEMTGTKTLVASGAISSFKSTEQGKYDWVNSKWPTFDGASWVCASRDAVRCYMDPRNFLYDPYIFQFELQTFNSNFHTLDGIREMIKGTFLDAKVETEGLVNANAAVSSIIPTQDINVPIPVLTPDMVGPGVANVMPILMNDKEVVAFSNVEVLGPGANIVNNSSGMSNVIDSTGNNIEEGLPTSYPYTYLPKGTYTYAELIYDACRQVNANPYVIISMILQEQGKNGTDSISGTNKKFKSAYNYGNVNAFAGGGLTAIENGLKYALTEGAYNRPWNTKEKGIYGLCDFYANSYVSLGQDTFYLKKWNVQGQNMFKHQYMTNVTGAASEGQLIGNAYDEKMLSIPHEFKIPYYENMPEQNCPIPVKDGSPNNKLKSLSIKNYIITPTFDKDVNDYTLIIDNSVNSVYIEAEAYDKKAAIGGVGNIATMTNSTYAIIYCVAENGDIRQYNINIFKKNAENIKAPTNNEYSPPTIVSPVTESILEPIAVPVTVPTNQNQVEYVGPGTFTIGTTNINTTQNFNNINMGEVLVGVGPGQ